MLVLMMDEEPTIHSMASFSEHQESYRTIFGTLETMGGQPRTKEVIVEMKVFIQEKTLPRMMELLNELPILGSTCQYKNIVALLS